ncbi:MAG: nucleoside-diphosphate kinase [Clostridiales bacterium]|nr:nucleoside-diphosphate kinase [Clostridiales bacterium]
MERTLILIKPDAVKRHLIGRIISIYEDNGLIIEGMYKRQLDKAILEKHYEEHVNRDFYPSLLEFMMEDEVIVLKVAGENAVQVVRDINGATNPSKARPATIRYIYGESVQRNVVHGSANLEDAKRELEIWF